MSLKSFKIGAFVALASLGGSLSVRAREPDFYPGDFNRSVQELKVATRHFLNIRDVKGTIHRTILSNSITTTSHPHGWQLLDPVINKVAGTSTNLFFSPEARPFFKPAVPLIVAVIDSGVDIRHPDLQGMIFTNEKEIPNNGIDDDHNGFIDDIHGWSFLGTVKKGVDPMTGRSVRQNINVAGNTLELTREKIRLEKIAKSRRLTRAEAARLVVVAQQYNEGHDEVVDLIKGDHAFRAQFIEILRPLIEEGLTERSIDAALKFKATTQAGIDAQHFIKDQDLDRALSVEVIDQEIAEYQSRLNYSYNLNFNSSVIVGDNPNLTSVSALLDEPKYGNPDVIGTNARHGTHCAGIIAAVRENGIGMDGQIGLKDFIKILPVRAVPDGDERDKDVSNAIRYAVNMGAKVISMSFGKAFASPAYSSVQAAIRFAQENDVLIVHAAGNDHKDLELPGNANFPSPLTAVNGEAVHAPNWIEVGANDATLDRQLPAVFSNFGSKTVDLFGPGVAIFSTLPNGSYQELDGTSMAAPNVAGVAAIIRTQFPNLTAPQVRDVLMASVTIPIVDDVNVPDGGSGPNRKVLRSFRTMSLSGGIVNLKRALGAAAKF